MAERRMMLYFIGIIGFLSMLGMSILTPILPAYIEQFGASPTVIGAIFSAYSASWVFLQVFTGHLSDRWGRKKFIVLGLCIYGIFGILVGRARTMLELLLLRTLQGTGVSLFGAPALALVGELPGESSKNFAFFRSCQGVGLAVGPFLGGFLSDAYGLHAPFYTTGAIGLFAALLGGTILKETRGKAEKGIPFQEALKILAQQRRLHLLIIIVFLSEFTYVGLELLFPLGGGQLGLSYSEIGLLFTGYMVIFSLTQTPLGVLSGKIGSYRRFLCLMSGGAATVFFLAAQVGSFEGMLLVSGGLAIFLGGMFTQSTAFASDLVPAEQKGVSLALFDAFIDSTFFVAPVLTGTLIGYVGLEGTFLVCALLNVVAFLILVSCLRTNQSDASTPPI